MKVYHKLTERLAYSSYYYLLQLEIASWRQHFLKVALGPEPTSAIGNLLAMQKLAHDRVVERHRKQRQALAAAEAEVCMQFLVAEGLFHPILSYN